MSLWWGSHSYLLIFQWQGLHRSPKSMHGRVLTEPGKSQVTKMRKEARAEALCLRCTFPVPSSEPALPHLFPVHISGKSHGRVVGKGQYPPTWTLPGCTSGPSEEEHWDRKCAHFADKGNEAQERRFYTWCTVDARILIWDFRSVKLYSTHLKSFTLCP